jgi:TRAP-type mannitol/chloroaromatic compound transport system permease small subunit
VIDLLHSVLYLLPGALVLALAGALWRFSRLWIATIAMSTVGDPLRLQRGPVWARRWVAGAAFILAGAGAALLALGVALAAILLGR